MRRREFIAGVGGAVAIWRPTARAQQPSKTTRIGFVGPSLNNPPAIAQYDAFRMHLAELDFREGQNLTIDYHGVDDTPGPFVIGAELARARPNLIVSAGPETSLQAVVGASGFVPVVMIAVNFDPLARGYIRNLARPGGNITGLVFQQLELAEKQVEVLTQTFPTRTRLAILYDVQSTDQFRAAEQATKALNLRSRALRLENPPYDFDAAFRAITLAGAEMVLVLSSPFFLQHQTRVIELANMHRLPSMFIVRHWVQVGGLMAYGADFPSMYRRAADYVAKILNGANAADLPVEQPTKFELVINLTTAKTLGLTIPPTILARADEVIE